MSEVRPHHTAIETATEFFGSLDDDMLTRVFGPEQPGLEPIAAPYEDRSIGRGPVEFLGDKFTDGLRYVLDKIVAIASSPS